MSLFAFICFIASFISFITYIIAVYLSYKPDCISNSFYLIPSKQAFTIWLIVVSFLIFPSWVEISREKFQFLPFLSIVALWIVGLFPHYLESERVIHISAAAITCILSLVWNIVMGIYIIPIILVICVVALAIFIKKNLLYWIEFLAFMNIYMSILFN